MNPSLSTLDKPAKKGKKPRKKLKNRNISSPQALADSAFSEYIRRTNADHEGNVRCVSCGKEMRWQDAHAGHYWRRGCFNVRYDEQNVHPQCPHCNAYLDGNMGAYADWMYSHYTRKEMADLFRRAHEAVRLYADDYDAIKVKYRAKLAELENER